MKQVRRFLMWAVLMAATAFAFSSCNKDDDATEKSNDGTTEQGGGSNEQGGENGGGNGENGGNGNNGGEENGGNNGGGENGGGNGIVGGHEYVDLGLPSGTLWATCNVGATKSEAYGDYFAWGETQPKKTYTSDNSEWCNVEYSVLKAQGVIDANGNLTARYDAATVNWGNDWRMPTSDEIRELLTLDNEYAEVNGVKGRKFMGNGNSLFLPFAGYRNESGLYYAGVDGAYWSATAYEDDWDVYSLYVYSLYMYSGGAHWDDDGNRRWGFTVRPVLRTK